MFFSSLMLGVAMLLGWYLYYGFDPREDKIEGYDSHKTAERIMTLLVQANADVSMIGNCAQQTASLPLEKLMQECATAFKKIIKHIEEEPDDYERARKYLVSYLGEIRSMCQAYVKLESRGRSDEMKAAFQQTLQSSIEKLDKQYERLIDEDMVDLDVKLSVMKKRLESEE
jgi:5-bromo-4-chloroindolyl phosphate hydrolysis protein